MSVRMWHLEAECWQCGTLIEISEATRAAIEEAMKQRPPSPVVNKPTANERIDEAHTSTLKARVDPPSLHLEPSHFHQLNQLWRNRSRSAFRQCNALHRPNPAPAPKYRRAPILLGLAGPSPSLVDQLTSASRFIYSSRDLVASACQDEKIVLSLSISKDRVEGDFEAVRREDPIRLDAPLSQQQLGEDEAMGLDQDASNLAQQLSRPEFSKGFQPSAIAEVKSRLNQP